MSSADIDRLASQFDRSMTIKGKTPINATPNTFNVVKKNFSGEKKRHARQYFKNQMRENRLQNEEQKMKEMLKRPKEEKVRYDTHRIAFTPNSADEELNDLHYANFLGDKYGDNKAPYNSVTHVNLKFCDAMREEGEANDEQSCDSLSDDETCELSLGSGEEYDDEVYQNLEWVEAIVKRQHQSYIQAIEDEEVGIEWEDEEPPLKRARLDDETFNV